MRGIKPRNVKHKKVVSGNRSFPSPVKISHIEKYVSKAYEALDTYEELNLCRMSQKIDSLKESRSLDYHFPIPLLGINIREL